MIVLYQFLQEYDKIISRKMHILFLSDRNRW